MAALPQSLPHRPVACPSRVSLPPHVAFSQCVHVHVTSLFLGSPWIGAHIHPTILSAKTPLPNKVTFTGPRDSDLNISATSASPTPHPRGHQPGSVEGEALSHWPRVAGGLPLAQSGWQVVLREVGVMLGAGAPPRAPPYSLWRLGTIVTLLHIVLTQHRSALLRLLPAGWLSGLTLWKVVRASGCLPAFPWHSPSPASHPRGPGSPCFRSRAVRRHAPRYPDTLSGSP